MDKVRLNNFILWCKYWYQSIDDGIDIITEARKIMVLDGYLSFEVNSKDGTKFTVDPSALIKISDGNSPAIFKKYRKDVDDIIKQTLYVYIKDAARIEFNKYNADQIVSNREAVDKSFEARVRECFLAEHFVLDQLSPRVSNTQNLMKTL